MPTKNASDGSDLLHSCANPACAERISVRKFSCPPCWHLLPADIRADIKKHYKGSAERQSAPYLIAAVRGVQWFRTQIFLHSGCSHAPANRNQPAP